MTITVEPVSEELWLVTIDAQTKTEHRVRVTAADLERFTRGKGDARELLQASFRFLLDREPNTSILRDFDLAVISRYFPEYERAITRALS
ncbi:MAG: hypothetical protein ABR589_09965 [Chthoniobacterales bacterium]